MSEPFLAEIRMVGFNFAPRGWATCDGQILPINQNQSLYSLLGTTYGGDGRINFALPDLRGRTPIHFGTAIPNPTNHVLGQKGGEEAVTLTAAQMPGHSHTLNASGSDATQAGPTDALLAKSTASGGQVYSGTSDPQNTTLGTSAITNAGSSQGHDNMQPCLTLNFCVALQGLFPSRN